MKSVTLTALNWHGDLPLPGQYLKAARGRTAYLILAVKLPRAGARYIARFVCERERPDRLRSDAVVYGWQWAGR